MYRGIELPRPSKQDVAEALKIDSGWADTHVEGIIVKLPINPDAFPDQDPEVVHLLPKPNFKLAQKLGEIGVGSEAYEQLTEDLRSRGLVQIVRDWPRIAADLNRARTPQEMEIGNSSVVITPHLKSILDSPLTHNALFVVSGDEQFADMNVILANSIVTQLAVMTEDYGPIPVTEALRISGHVLIGIEKEGAAKRKVPASVVNYRNSRLDPALRGLYAKGIVVHRSPTNTRSKRAILPNGEIVRVLPQINLSDAVALKRRTPKATPVAVDITNKRAAFRVLPTRTIKKKEEIHSLMEELADATSEVTNETVAYGLPEGAVLLDENGAAIVQETDKTNIS